MKRSIRILAVIWLTLFLGSLGVPAFGQELLLDGNVQRMFTSQDGLASTSTTAIAQTTEGFIWIGGYGGLVRYDGRSFDGFEENGISAISALLSGDDGILYAATADSGLYRYKDGVFSSLSGESGIMEVECLAMDAGGKVWFGTENGIGYVDEEDVPRMVDIPELREVFIHRILCSGDGCLQIVTRSGKLYTYDGKECLEPALPTDEEHVRSIFQRPDGGYYIGTSGSSVWKTDASFRIEETIRTGSLRCVNDISLSDEGILWLCTDNGIAAYRDGELRVQRMKMDNSVDLMMTDMEGNTWFVSSRQGVLEVSSSRFTNISQSAGLPGMMVNAIERIGNRLYVGHDDGLMILDADTCEILEDPDFSELASVRIRCLYAGGEGDLWIGTKGKGLLRYKADRTWETYSSKTFSEIHSDSFRCICEHDGELLCGTDMGAYVISDGKVRNIVNDPDAFKLRVLGIDAIGDVTYLGTDGYGLYMVKDGEILGHTTTEDGLNSNVIMKFCKSRATSGLWLVTGNRLAYISEDGQIRSIETLPSRNNLDFLILDGDVVWIFTGSGIFQTSEQSLLNDEILNYTLYRHEDGMPFEIVPNSNQCLAGNLLYLCGSGGISGLDLLADEKEGTEYHLAFDGMYAGGERLQKDESGAYVLGSDVRRVEMGAHILTYQSGNPWVYYYLEKFDQEPVKKLLRDIGPISYTNLAGGDYRFHFGVLDSRTMEPVSELTIPFRKEYKWYERWEVQMGLAILTAGLLLLATVLFIRMSNRKLRRKLAREYEKQEKEHLRQIAYRDYLTGLYNRNYLEAWDEQIRPDEPFPVTFISADLNNLKLLNDTYGHKRGDQLLQEMADLLKKHFSEDNFYVLRVGGDEFLVLCCGITMEEAGARMEALRADAETHRIEGIPVTFGYGLCTQDREEYDFDEGLRLSDLMMLEDKKHFHGR